MSCPASPRATHPPKSYVVLITLCGALGLVAVLLLAPPMPLPLGVGPPTEHPAWQQEACQQQHAAQGIPRIIHQSYKTKRLPPDFAEWQQSWFRLHPSWCYMFWTDQDNRCVVGSCPCTLILIIGSSCSRVTLVVMGSLCDPAAALASTPTFSQKPCASTLPMVSAALRCAAQAYHARRCCSLPLHAQVWRPVL